MEARVILRSLETTLITLLKADRPTYLNFGSICICINPYPEGSLALVCYLLFVYFIFVLINETKNVYKYYFLDISKYFFSS